MKNSKLKRKLWRISLLMLLTYITVLILNPSSLITLLPIIIPAGIITITIPAYTIIKNKKEPIKKEVNKLDNKKENQNNVKKTNSNNLINTNQINTTIEPQNKQEKPKIKTKGTINQ